MKKFDMHVHTRYSLDNYAEPEDMIVAAIARGLDGIVITEHDSFPDFEEIEKLRRKYYGKLTVLLGMEFSTVLGLQCGRQHWDGVDSITNLSQRGKRKGATSCNP